MLNVPQSEIVIGVPGYLLLPQRPYWRLPSGKAVLRRFYNDDNLNFC